MSPDTVGMALTYALVIAGQRFTATRPRTALCLYSSGNAVAASVGLYINNWPMAAGGLFLSAHALLEIRKLRA